MGSFARTVRLIMRGFRDVRAIVRQLYVINSLERKEILVDNKSQEPHYCWLLIHP